MTTASKAYICPTCSSTCMVLPALVGAPYKCEACGWEGCDPLLVPFGNPYGSEAETLDAFSAELLNAFAKSSAHPLGALLIKWGFVPRDKSNRPAVPVLARYIKAMATGMVKAVLLECRNIEMERTRGQLD
jgi:hypothetical protein